MKVKYYRKKELQSLFPWTPDLPVAQISISDADKANGSPKKGDMIACNPKDVTDYWLVAEKYFRDNYIFVEETRRMSSSSIRRGAVKTVEWWKHLRNRKRAQNKLVRKDGKTKTKEQGE